MLEKFNLSCLRQVHVMMGERRHTFMSDYPINFTREELLRILVILWPLYLHQGCWYHTSFVLQGHTQKMDLVVATQLLGHIVYVTSQ